MIESDERVLAEPAFPDPLNEPSRDGEVVPARRGAQRARPCGVLTAAGARAAGEEDRRLLAGLAGPSPRVWQRIESTLRREGLIRE